MGGVSAAGVREQPLDEAAQVEVEIGSANPPVLELEQGHALRLEPLPARRDTLELSAMRAADRPPNRSARRFDHNNVHSPVVVREGGEECPLGFSLYVTAMGLLPTTAALPVRRKDFVHDLITPSTRRLATEFRHCSGGRGEPGSLQQILGH
jgi:hypothetical protein